MSAHQPAVDWSQVDCGDQTPVTAGEHDTSRGVHRGQFRMGSLIFFQLAVALGATMAHLSTRDATPAVAWALGGLLGFGFLLACIVVTVRMASNLSRVGDAWRFIFLAFIPLGTAYLLLLLIPT